ncbi:MAG: deoxynucleoside kinase [Ignavibacteria bacterium]|nr:deoxynucleoside kinase [Ignavibacteria bacterium]MCC7158699.1 deoxynucleoside kinase [Ignavibacteria bacterium]
MNGNNTNNQQLSYIAVEGVIGAGKTSVASMLSERLNAKLILENFEDNPFLEKFYIRPGDYAFRTQMFFLLERYTQLQELHQKDLFQNYIVSDYIFEKDKIFAYLNLSDDELKIYEQVVQGLDRNVVVPDLVIYLQSTVERLMSNITKRSRDIEKEISEEYIDNLNDAYNYFFSRYKSSKLMIVNCEETDFVNNPLDFDRLVEEIFRNDQTAVKYYNPSLRKAAE